MTPTASEVRPRPERASVTLEAYLHDVDALGIVWHGHYYRFFEVARTALLARLGLTVEVWSGLPYHWVVVESRCRHTAPLRLGQRFRVEAWLDAVEYRVDVGFAVVDDDGTRVATGHTHLATVDGGGKLQLTTPSELLRYVAVS